MTIQQLEYLVALDRFGQFARAANECNVTQPTLSTMVSRLEKELGITIFDRNHQPIVPTTVGEKIVEQARRILDEVNVVNQIIQEEKGSLSGSVTIGVLPTIAPGLVHRVLPLWREAFGDIELKIVELKTSQCLEQLLSREIDLAIIASEAQTSGLSDELLYFEEFAGYVSENEPLFQSSVIRSSEVDGNRLWLLDEGHCFRDQLVRFCHLPSLKSRQLKYEQGSIESFMHIVESGQGMTFIPQLIELDLSERQRKFVRPFAIPRPVREIRLAHRNDYVRQTIMRMIIETIRKAVPKNMLKIGNTQSIAK